MWTADLLAALTAVVSEYRGDIYIDEIKPIVGTPFIQILTSGDGYLYWHIHTCEIIRAEEMIW